MKNIEYFLSTIENSWFNLALLAIVFLHLGAFSGIGMFRPWEINRPNPDYCYNLQLFGRFVIGGFEWVGFKTLNKSLPSGKKAYYVLFGFYYVIVII